ncbi:MAG: glycosyltransferase [Polaromonas sp.]|nr:glycosyltransferase [Polaromonas sp.]
MLMLDLQAHCADARFELILTLNIGEEPPDNWANFSQPNRLIRNPEPRGFGENHNQAFSQSAGRLFCVLNPDIRLTADPFAALHKCLDGLAAALVAPVVVGVDGRTEESARLFPSPLRIARRVFGPSLRADYAISDQPLYPDWVGGMFMLFSREAFEQVKGFDERYFLYYEDVDICARLRLMGHQIAVCPQAQVIHCAQRRSHRSARYLVWHFTSMTRFFLSSVYRQLSQRARP